MPDFIDFPYVTRELYTFLAQKFPNEKQLRVMFVVSYIYCAMEKLFFTLQ